MSERLKTFVALASLGLFVVAVVACARSYLPPTLRFRSDSGRLLIVSMFVQEESLAETARQISGGEDAMLRWMSEYPHIKWRFLGFGYMSGTSYSLPYRIFIVPYWFILLVTGAFPLAWGHRRRRLRTRRRAGQCPQCGYDLRATPGKCPECGWTMPATA